MTSLVSNLLVFVALIALGYLLRRRGTVSERLEADLNYLVMRVTLPAMLFVGLLKPFDAARLALGLFALGLSLGIYAVSFAIGWLTMLLCRVPEPARGVWLLGCAFSNIGYMGFPVIAAIYGPDGLFLASFVAIGWNLLSFPIGALLVSRGNPERPRLREVFLNPVMAALALGTILFVTRVPVPDMVRSVFVVIGDLTGPLAMLIIGLRLGTAHVGVMFANPRAYALSLVRLVIIPFAIVGLFRLIPGVHPLVVAVLVIIAAMPTANLGTLLANEYGGDAHFAAQGTALSTLASLATLPLVYAVVGG